MSYQTILAILLAAPPIILAVTLHEAAHARAALWCGDTTAKALGRITLNPFKHIDPIGTIAVPIGLFLLSQLSNSPLPIFGWAKPVPVNIGALRNPLRDQFWVSSAGPFANFVMLILWAMIYHISGLLTSVLPDLALEVLTAMSVFGVTANLGLMVLNLLPILPLDGGRILMSILPRRLAWKFSQTERYGMFILLFLLMTKTLDYLFIPIFQLIPWILQ